MPRLRQVGRDAAHPFAQTVYKSLFGDRDPVVSPGTETGTPGNWWTVFALVPDVLRHAVRGFALYASPKRVLPPQLRELGQTRAGWTIGSQFVYSQHCKSLRSLDVSEERIAAVPHWAASDRFDETERLVLAYTDCLVYDRGRVPDGLFDALHGRLSDEEILELTYITALYLHHAVMSRALRTEWDDRPEPITEVMVEGVDEGRDVGRDISLPPS